MTAKGFTPRGHWSPNSATISALGPQGVDAIRAVDNIRAEDSLDIARELDALSNGAGPTYGASMTATITANSVVLGQIGTTGHTAALTADLTITLPTESAPRRYTVLATAGPGVAGFVHVQQKDEKQFEVRLYDTAGVAVDLSAADAVLFITTRGD